MFKKVDDHHKSKGISDALGHAVKKQDTRMLKVLDQKRLHESNKDEEKIKRFQVS